VRFPIFHDPGVIAMSPTEHDPLELNAEEQRVYELLGKVSDQELRRMAKLLAGKGDAELFGHTEFELRDRVHALGARALEAVAEERQKKGWIRRC
jgi:hypothetical protein